jgi:nucleoside-diphosphate-sugar epimerase
MSSSDQLHVVLGASDGLDAAVVQELVNQGKRVRAINRSPIEGIALRGQVELMQGDITDPDRIIQGKPLNLIGNLDVLHTYTFVEDFAKGLVMLGEREEALGEIWHVPSAETLTTRKFLDLVFAEAKQTPKLKIASPLKLNLLGLFCPMLRELKEISYEFEQNFVVNHQKYEQAFGKDVTPHQQALQKTIAWFYDRHTKDVVYL